MNETHSKGTDMELCAAIDLHSNNSMLVVLDKDDHVIVEQRLRKACSHSVDGLAPSHGALCRQCI